MDYRKGGRLAVRWFLKRGIRSLWLAGCGSSFLRWEFLAGWIEELTGAGIVCGEHRMIPLSAVHPLRNGSGLTIRFAALILAFIPVPFIFIFCRNNIIMLN